MDLGYGFKIYSKAFNDFAEFIMELTGGLLFEDSNAVSNWFHEMNPFFKSNKDVVIYIYNDRISDHPIPRKDGSEVDYYGNGEYIYEIEDYPSSYIDPVLRIMRLFDEGNIKMPSYIESRNDVASCHRGRYHFIHDEVYRLDSSKRNELQIFIHKVNLPLKRSYLQLSFENYEHSYEVHNRMLSFILLMISMEVIFNPGHSRVKENISRNAAALLGKDTIHSKKIYKRIRNYYKMRSELIHLGKSDEITNEDVLNLRNYVRVSLRKALVLDKEKGLFLKLLKSS